MTNAKQKKGSNPMKSFFFLIPCFIILVIIQDLSFLRYDYLEFTDARGGKVRYDHKVGTDKWPKVSRVKKSSKMDGKKACFNIF